jgi:signal transduction histidine kinase
LTKIPDPTITDIDTENLFTQLLLLMKKVTEDRNIDVKYEVKPKTLHIQVDEKLIEQVLINLIKNAIEAGEGMEKLMIELTAEEQNGKVKIKVSDNGPGISPEVIDNIFVPFYTTKKEGSGIGLSLSKQILRKHGGNLEVISTEGEGATFIVTL